MKTLRTVLATFGVTTLLYGAFALLTVGIDPAFAGRSIYQLFRDTGFPAVVIGIACLLSVAILVFAAAAFRDDVRARRTQEDEDRFLEEETVAVEDYEERWSPELKRKSRAALSYESDEPAVDESPVRSPRKQKMQHCIFCGTVFPISEAVCPKCGKRA